MPSTLAPFGLRPAYHGSGGIVRPTVYTITSGYATNILAGAPVKIVPSSTGEGTIAFADPADRAIGNFEGVRWTDSDGITRFSNKWTASTVLLTNTTAEAWVTEDPNVFYEIQANDTLTVADIGKQYNWSVESGSTVTGLSAVSLDVSSVATNNGLQIMGLRNGPNNAWGDAYPIVTVRISEHQFVADVAGF